MNWLTTIAAVVSIAASLGVLTYVRKIARVVSVQKDYPPHRHVGHSISYPPDFAPGQVQQR